MREFPAADRIAGTFADDELAFLAISDDRKTDEVRQIIEKVGTSLPILLDKGSNTLKAYGVRLPPTLYLIDKDHKVSRVWIGSIRNREAEIIESVKTLLKSDAPTAPAE